MAMSLFETTESKFDVTLNDVHLLQSETFQFILRNISWKIQIEKATDCTGDNINVHLERIIRSEDQSFNCIAMVLIELKSFDERIPSHVGRIDPFEFSGRNRKFSLIPFIKCDMLYDPAKRFVDENRAQLKILIKADERKPVGSPARKRVFLLKPDILKPSALDKSKELDQVHLFRFFFQKVDKCLAVISREFTVFDLPLRMQIFKNKPYNDENDGSLSVYLWNWCHDEWNHEDKMVSLQAKVKLLSTDPDYPGFERNTGIVKFCKNVREGFQHFISWHQLQMKYIKADGSITMEVEIMKVNPEPEVLKRCSSPNSGPSTSHDVKPSKLIKLEQTLAKCECCFESMECKTLFRIACGHLYCDECIENDLNTRKTCVNCDRPNDPSVSPKMILFS